MDNFLQEGTRLEYINATSADIASSAPVLVGSRLGIAVGAILNTTPNSVGILAMDGVYTITKLTADVVSQGDELYWDDTNKRLTLASTGNTLAGYAHKAANGSATTVECRINR